MSILKPLRENKTIIYYEKVRSFIRDSSNRTPGIEANERVN